MATLPTSHEVRQEGQFRAEYFPETGGEASVDNLISGWITSAAAYVKRQVGSYYDTSDTDIAKQITDCIKYLVLARAWQVIMNVMVAYDSEPLPVQYVDPAAAAINRDYYREEAQSILVQYDTKPGPRAFVGAFRAGGAIEEDTETILGLKF